MNSEVIYRVRGTILKEPLIFGPLLFGSLVSFAFIVISLVLGRRPPD